MASLNENLLCEDYSKWIIQGFVRSSDDLELFLVPSLVVRKNNDVSPIYGRSILLQNIKKMDIWDFRLIRYEMLKYLLAVPAGEDNILLFSSYEGCHGQIVCSEMNETAFENPGRWIATYTLGNNDGSIPEVRKQIENEVNWHDYSVDGFLRYDDEVEILLSYPQQEIAIEGAFHLAGKIKVSDILKQEISNFQRKNVLSYIKVASKGENLLVDFDCSVGCNGLITCGNIEQSTWKTKGEWKLLFK